MDHEMVVRENISEKYLLAELEPGMRNEFEEHFFGCPECAQDIRAGAELVLHSKNILAESSEPVLIPAARPKGNQAGGNRIAAIGAFFRPAFALPVLALLLAVIGYQNFVTLPRLARDMNQPQILPAATVNLLTYGGNAAPLSVRAGEGFLLNVVVPPGNKYDNYRADLYGPDGKVAVSLPIPGASGDVWSIRFPAQSQSGVYKLNVRAVTGYGVDVQVGSGSFELGIQK